MGLGGPARRMLMRRASCIGGRAHPRGHPLQPHHATALPRQPRVLEPVALRDIGGENGGKGLEVGETGLQRWGKTQRNRQTAIKTLERWAKAREPRKAKDGGKPGIKKQAT